MEPHLVRMMDHDKMLNISRIIRTTCATAPVCRIKLKISPPTNDAKTGAKTGATPDPAVAKPTAPELKTPELNVPEVNNGPNTPLATMDANRGNCKFIIAKSTASIS
jgi:hypothetical protein